MGSKRRIAIAGIASHWGSELALQLERDHTVERIFGLDSVAPQADFQRTEWIEIDIRSPTISRVLPATGVDTVVHCGVVWYPEEGKPARALHDINVIGTLQLLAACDRTTELQRIVVRGSAAIYGSEPAAPSFFTEPMARSYPLRTRFQRDIGELEAYVENFARRHPRLTCCMLRFQPELGSGLPTPLARYLSLPVVPTQLGFDPRLQLLHADDATGALVAATMDPVGGAVNVAPTGAVSLSRILRLAGRVELPVPHPLFGPATARLGARLGLGTLSSDAVAMLRFGRGVDNARLRGELGFQPRFDAVGTIRDFAERSEAPRLAAAPRAAPLLARLAGEPR